MAAQQPKYSQNGPRQLGLLGCAPCSPSRGPFWPLSSPNPPKRTPCSPSGGPFWPLSSPNPPKRTSPARSAWLAPWWSRFGRSAAQILPKRTLPAWSAWLCSVLSLGGPFCPNPPKRTSPCWSAWLSSLLSSGGPFWPLSSPNPPKRASLAWSAGLCSLLFVWWSVLAAQQPKSVNTDPPSTLTSPHRSLSLSLAGAPFCPLSGPNPPKRTSPAWSAWVCSFLSPLVVRFGKSSKTDLASLVSLARAPCSPSDGPFWPLSSPNTPKRTSPAWSAWLCSLLSLWWSVLAAQQPKSSKTDLAMLVCLAVLLALPLVVRFGRSAAQILQ